jgi:hypothetical protein
MLHSKHRQITTKLTSAIGVEPLASPRTRNLFKLVKTPPAHRVECLAIGDFKRAEARRMVIA